MTEEESKAYDSVLNGHYTIPRGYYSKLKHYGINVQKGFIVLAAFMFAMQTQKCSLSNRTVFTVCSLCDIIYYFSILSCTAYSDRRYECQCYLVLPNS